MAHTQPAPRTLQHAQYVVVEEVVMKVTTDAALACETVVTGLVDCRTAWARQHQRPHAEPQAHCYPQSVVVEVEAQRSNWCGT